MVRSRLQEDGSARINKRQAVREAMEGMGMDAAPAAIQSHLREKLGLDLSTNMISSYKSQIRNQAGLQSKRRNRRGRPRMSLRGVSGVDLASDDISLKDLRILKEMANRLGADRLRALFEILCE
jgi:hypothetical protein